jgi:uncharacterized protein YciI
MIKTTYTIYIEQGLMKRSEHLSKLEEREATQDLLLVGLKLAQTGISVSEQDIDIWLRQPEDIASPFTKPEMALITT